VKKMNRDIENYVDRKVNEKMKTEIQEQVTKKVFEIMDK